MNRYQEEEILVRFRWIHPERDADLGLPTYTTEFASGMDISAAVDSSLVMQPMERVLVPTGLSVAIPSGFEIEVRPRSGLAIKHGITVINSPGTIDSDYRGEIKIGLINLSSDVFVVSRGDRIAQLVVSPVARVRCEVVTQLDDTVRGDGGFGHTGV